MKTDDFTPLRDAALRYLDAVDYINGLERRDAGRDLAMLSTVQADFHRTANPETVLALFNFAAKSAAEAAHPVRQVVTLPEALYPDYGAIPHVFLVPLHHLIRALEAQGLTVDMGAVYDASRDRV